MDELLGTIDGKLEQGRVKEEKEEKKSGVSKLKAMMNKVKLGVKVKKAIDAEIKERFENRYYALQERPSGEEPEIRAKKNAPQIQPDLVQEILDRQRQEQTVLAPII